MVTYFNDHTVPLQQFASTASQASPLLGEQQDRETKFEIQAVEKRTAEDTAMLLFDHRDAKHSDIQETFSITCFYRQQVIIRNAFVYQRALFITLPSAIDQESFHACIIRLIEFAEEQMPSCDSLIIIVEKNNKMTHTLLRALLYFGFQLVDPVIYCHTPAYVLLGYELN
ncbi:hypothetical protein BX666DRAFT_2028040 [Dichotomocladium elegans]|nr:hypothetical protein BX666DRAFT_2028040 [Dichotomocladium elegans]